MRRLFQINAAAAAASKAHRACDGRSLKLETLEPRLALSAPGLVDVGAQPDGGLAGKVVYIHAGHGYTADTGAGGVGGSGAWSFQRPLLLGMVEDLGNQDQMTFLADYLFRAGATIAPLRPIGYQPLEVVLDNDDAGVTFTGDWTNSNSSIYFGSVGDVPYRFATTSATETAVARYRPEIAQAGFFPVYAWSHYGSDRAADQLYRINHSGGSTEVTVNHRRVGDGLVYLGTYYFDAGTAGSVEISNRSSEPGRVVIADMIRFGNGVGDIARAAGVSGRGREDEAGLYWVEWHVAHAQGIPPTEYRNLSQHDRDSTVSLSPRYAEYMNRQQDGALSDRVFVSYHSNAGGGRGVLGLYNGNNTPSTATPNQFLLAKTLGQEVNDDLVAQNGQFEFNWFNVGTNVTLDRSDIEFGEINNSVIHDEFDATIVEVAFHDNSTDAALMRDPKVRDAVARATYQGIVKYFRGVDGNATPLTMLPGRVTQVRAESVGPGSVQLTWTAPTANAYNGDAPTGYRIYGSSDGYGFDGGTFVAGGATTTHTMSGLSAAEGAYYFKVVAVNEGGEGVASEVVAAIPTASENKLLIVNGFDRLGRTQNPTQAVPGGQAERVRPRQSNSFDYAAQVAEAIEASAPSLAVDSASNEMVAAGTVNLSNYAAVVWILGEESTADDTFTPAEQAQVSAYLAAGGKIFLSGSEIGFDLDAQGGGATFYNSTLRADYVADDANTYAVAGAPTSIFAGLSFSFDNGQSFYDVNFPDRISPLNGAATALTYSTGGAAAVQYADSTSGSKLVMLAFPFETITDAAMRNAVMARVLEYFELGAPPQADFDGNDLVDGADLLAWQRGVGTSPATPEDGDADQDGDVDEEDLAIWKVQYGDAAPLGIADSSAVAISRREEEEPLLTSSEMTALAQRARDLLLEDVGRHRVPIVDRRARSDSSPISALEFSSGVPSTIKERDAEEWPSLRRASKRNVAADIGEASNCAVEPPSDLIWQNGAP
jgi:N-acetylmuramoyl-L-alanine amidase